MTTWVINGFNNERMRIKNLKMKICENLYMRQCDYVSMQQVDYANMWALENLKMWLTIGNYYMWKGDLVIIC